MVLPALTGTGAPGFCLSSLTTLPRAPEFRFQTGNYATEPSDPGGVDLLARSSYGIFTVTFMAKKTVQLPLGVSLSLPRRWGR